LGRFLGANDSSSYQDIRLSRQIRVQGIFHREGLNSFTLVCYCFPSAISYCFLLHTLPLCPFSDYRVPTGICSGNLPHQTLAEGAWVLVSCCPKPDDAFLRPSAGAVFQGSLVAQRASLPVNMRHDTSFLERQELQSQNRSTATMLTVWSETRHFPWGAGLIKLQASCV